MFDRYTEIARRAIFYARQEASNLASPFIECDHLVLALLRENTPLRRQLTESQREAIRSTIQPRAAGTSPSTVSVDLPLSHDAKRALAYGAEEAQRLRDKHIDAGHLMLGLLRIEPVAELLTYDIRLDDQRALLAESEGGELIPHSKYEESPLRTQLERLDGIISRLLAHLDRSPSSASVRLRRKPWTRKEALGHLIDWATAHHQLFARALTEPNVQVPMPVQDSWVEAQDYSGLVWPPVERLWADLNRLIFHVLARMPAEKLNTPCRIGIAEPVPLVSIVEAYVDHCEDIAAQILLHSDERGASGAHGGIQ